MHLKWMKILLLATLALVFIRPTFAQIDTTKYRWVEVASGFDRPLFVTHAGDGSERIFVVEQTGFIEKAS